MSQLNKRITQCEELRKDLKDSEHRKMVTKYSYIQLLDYHIALLKELDDLVEAINSNNEAYVNKWYKYRVTNETNKLEG